MAQQARYTTFRAGELESEIRARGGNPNAPFGLPTSSGTGRLRKAHSCLVRFPDGSEGRCRYERGGPAWHLFHFEQGQFEQGQTTEGVFRVHQHLPRQCWTKTLGNDVASIEAKAREMADASFADAIEREKREYFMRASEGMGRSKKPALFAMTAGKAKRLSGRYALCCSVGKTLVCLGRTFPTLSDANAAWQARADASLVVACCNRLDRCWQRPRFNPLKEFNACEGFSLTEKGDD